MVLAMREVPSWTVRGALAEGLAETSCTASPQGGLSQAQGGTFRSGFWGGALASAVPIDQNAGFVRKAITGAVVGGTASRLGGGKFANGAMSGAFVQMFNHGMDGVRLTSDESKSGFEIDQEGAVKIYKKLGLPNPPDPLTVTMDGLVLADDMLSAAVGADELIKLLEPSPYQQMKALPIIKRFFSNAGKQVGNSYWHTKIDSINIGMGARAGVMQNTDLMYRYRLMSQ